MKHLRTSAVCASLMLYSLCSSAQSADKIPVNEPDYNKTKLFQAIPENVPVSLDNITTLFQSAVGTAVGINLSEELTFRFEGTVVSQVSKYNNTIESVVVRSSNYAGARLSLSRITAADGSIAYTGRIVSMQHGDLFELKQTNNQFTLVKRNFHDLVNE